MEAVRRLVLCTGKVYVDLPAARPGGGLRRHRALEELYPFPADELQRVLTRYPTWKTWCGRRKSRNKGAWTYLPSTERSAGTWRARLRYIGRPERASPSEGTSARHAAEQTRIVDEVYANLGQD